jgi:hypothetical protein
MDTKGTLVAHLDFLVSERGQDEAALLALALRTGIETLYQETLVEAYLLGRVTREKLLAEIGPDHLAEIESQRDALRHDVAWGLKGV